VTSWYLNGDAVRYALLSVNGGAGTPVSFPSTGSFYTVGSIQRTVTLNTGCNTVKFYNSIVGNWAPDFDRIEVNCHITPPTDLRPQDLFSWSFSSVRNLTLHGSRYFSIDSGSINIVGFNQTPAGDFGDWLSAFGPTLAAGWGLRGAADFNRDGYPDYALFAPTTFKRPSRTYLGQL
jgi:hypothetical protein